MTCLCPYCGATVDGYDMTNEVWEDDPKFFHVEHHIPLQCWKCKQPFHEVWKSGKIIGVKK